MSNYREIFDAIKNRELRSLYLFTGPEEYIKAQALSQLMGAVLDAGMQGLNCHQMEGSALEPGDIIASCETLPFMAERRLVIVKDHPGLGGRKAAEDDRLKEYLPGIPETTCLVFYQRGDADKGRALYKALKKHGAIIDFDRLKEPELIKWTAAQLKKQGKEMARADLEYFLMLAGNHLEDIANELQKLSGLAGERKVIGRPDIDAVVTPQPEYTVFQLIDAISLRDAGRALLLLDQLLGSGQSVLGIISMLSRQLKTMLLIKDMGREPLSRIQERLGAAPYKLHPFAVKKSMEHQKGFSREQLLYGLSECLALDYGIKDGRRKERLGMEMLIVRLVQYEALKTALS